MSSAILGISAFYHDSAAALVDENGIVAAAQEERFTRKKQDSGFPTSAVRYCLEEAGLSSSELRAVIFYDKPWAKFERLLENYVALAPRGLLSYMEAIPIWLKDKLWINKTIDRQLGEYKGELLFCRHHESHAASAFYPSPFEESAILTLDGVGEWHTTTWGTGNGRKIELSQKIDYPHSLGLLYSAFTYYTGFKVNSGEYKVMGLAPYGEPAYVNLILDEIIDLKEDGSFRLNMDYFGFHSSLKMTNSRFDKLFGGPPRTPESELTQKEMDLARSIQEVIDLALLKLARHIRKQSGMRNLCLAGGVALNCVANGKLLREGIFDDIWIQPAAGDAGGALGAALFAHHNLFGEARTRRDGKKDAQKASLLGPSYSGECAEGQLNAFDAVFHSLPDEVLMERLAELLAQEKVIGWFSGRMEFGPRALGARSIIGDPRSTKMQSVMNLKIKYRESFRPFAPSVLEEDIGECFELDRPSPYMLLVSQVKKERCREMTGTERKLFGISKLNVVRSDLPAITHVDYSARVQSVSREESPRYHLLISAFKKRSGCPTIINTSFNVRGEPIVCTPKDAYRCFMRTEIDVLVIDNLILFKEEQPAFRDDKNWREEYGLD
ncbi:MAG: carbamoyltransferase [Planctomycetes bacterium]|nr:carbamoyltransferase [Planctomycetota bacterium]